MQEQESLPDEEENTDSRTGTDEEEEQPVSRIVIEFGGLGEADVRRASFENISLGQMMMFARYAEWQCKKAITQYEHAQRAETQRKKIVVPGMGLVQ